MLSMPILKRAYRNRCVSKFDEYDPFRLNSIHGIKNPKSAFSAGRESVVLGCRV